MIETFWVYSDATTNQTAIITLSQANVHENRIVFPFCVNSFEHKHSFLSIHQPMSFADVEENFMKWLMSEVKIEMQRMVDNRDLLSGEPHVLTCSRG